MRRPRLVLSVALAALLGGCAGIACDPATIIVARKDERARLQGEPRGLRTDERGRVSEVQRQVIVTDYWVQDGEGRWYRVPEAAWRGIEPGQPLQICR